MQAGKLMCTCLKTKEFHVILATLVNINLHDCLEQPVIKLQISGRPHKEHCTTSLQDKSDNHKENELHFTFLLASKFQTFRAKNEGRSGQLSYVIDFGSCN